MEDSSSDSSCGFMSSFKFRKRFVFGIACVGFVVCVLFAISKEPNTYVLHSDSYQPWLVPVNETTGEPELSPFRIAVGAIGASMSSIGIFAVCRESYTLLMAFLAINALSFVSNLFILIMSVFMEFFAFQYIIYLIVNVIVAIVTYSLAKDVKERDEMAAVVVAGVGGAP